MRWPLFERVTCRVSCRVVRICDDGEVWLSLRRRPCEGDGNTFRGQAANRFRNAEFAQHLRFQLQAREWHMRSTLSFRACANDGDRHRTAAGVHPDCCLCDCSCRVACADLADFPSSLAADCLSYGPVDWVFGLAGDAWKRALNTASRGVASLSRIAYFLLPEINEDGETRERATSEVSEKVDGCCSVEYPFRLPAKRWIPGLDFGTAD